jgi:hypothetical protein
VARGFFSQPPDGPVADKQAIEEAPAACLVALSCTAILCIVLFFVAGRIQTLLTGL